MNWFWLTIFGLALAAFAVSRVFAKSSSRWVQGYEFVLCLVLIWAAFGVAGGLGLVILLGTVAAAELIRFAQRRRRLA